MEAMVNQSDVDDEKVSQDGQKVSEKDDPKEENLQPPDAGEAYKNELSYHSCIVQYFCHSIMGYFWDKISRKLGKV